MSRVSSILIIDDWGLAKLGDMERRNILEVLEDRHGITSTVIALLIPIDKWHDAIGDPTLELCTIIVKNNSDSSRFGTGFDSSITRAI